MKLLLIEDDPSISSSLYNLLRDSFTIHIARQACVGLSRLSKEAYDIILLDLNLPDRTGLEVCVEIRQQDILTPIIIISGISQSQSKTQLLESGANDYVTKPFNVSELLARIRVQCRQINGKVTSRTIKIGELTLDSHQQIAMRGEAPIALRRKEFYLLECLMLNAGRVVDSDILGNYAWDEATSSANNVHVQISNLRQKVDKPFGWPMIRTVHGRGYILEKPVTKRLA